MVGESRNQVEKNLAFFEIFRPSTGLTPPPTFFGGCLPSEKSYPSLPYSRAPGLLTSLIGRHWFRGNVTYRRERFQSLWILSQWWKIRVMSTSTQKKLIKKGIVSSMWSHRAMRQYTLKKAIYTRCYRRLHSVAHLLARSFARKEALSSERDIREVQFWK